MAQDRKLIATRPGFVMGMFAFGHPFLDDNGRTMLLVHAEMCFRAGMSIDWAATSKARYLEALTKELVEPRAGHLDTYLKPFVGAAVPRDPWKQAVAVMPGLDGVVNDLNVSASYDDPAVAEGYRAFEQRRGYEFGS